MWIKILKYRIFREFKFNNRQITEKISKFIIKIKLIEEKIGISFKKFYLKFRRNDIFKYFNFFLL